MFFYDAHDLLMKLIDIIGILPFNFKNRHKERGTFLSQMHRADSQ
jgi:hypothetical protein